MIAALTIPVGLVFIATGIACYLGRWRSWATPGRAWYAPGFGILYAGIGMLVAGLLVLVLDELPRPVVIAGLVLMTAFFALAILSLFWLPAFLTPRWFREQKRSTDAVRRWGGRR